KVMNLGLAAVAKRIAPGNALAQFGIIFGANTLITTGVPLLQTYLETNGVPEETQISLVVNFLMSAVMALIGARIHAQLAEPGQVTLKVRTDVVEQAKQLGIEATGIFEELRSLFRLSGVNPGAAIQMRLKPLQERAAKVLPEFIKILNRLADATEFNDA